MQNGGMLAAVSAAVGESNADDIVVDAAYIKTQFPSVAAALIGEGQQAERERILGIEKAALPGHEAIIAAHKADGSKTPADAAMAIIAAENETRGRQMAALKTDEEQVKVRSEPANPAGPSAESSLAGKTGEDLWKAEYEASADLRKEFASVGEYVAFKRAEGSGQARILKK